VRYLTGVGDIIKIQMCTKGATPEGNERDDHIKWALDALVKDTGERYDIPKRTQAFVSDITLDPY
jgi:hypothetical protein